MPRNISASVAFETKQQRLEANPWRAAIRDNIATEYDERNLLRMEARYRGLLETAPDAIIVVNQRSEIVLLNAQTENQFGYHRDELLGQKVKKLIPEGFAERLIADGTRTAAEALAQRSGPGLSSSVAVRMAASFQSKSCSARLKAPLEFW